MAAVNVSPAHSRQAEGHFPVFVQELYVLAGQALNSRSGRKSRTRTLTPLPGVSGISPSIAISESGHSIRHRCAGRNCAGRLVW
jgi:hypothetical protein